MRTIPLKESLEIEFKSDKKPYPDKELIEDVVGMANVSGGTIFLGVEDDGRITGVHEKHNDSIGVVALIANSTVPPISARAEIINEEKKDVLRIDVPRSRGVVATTSGKMRKRKLKLDGTPEVVPMYPYEIPSRLSSLGLLDYSAQALPGAAYEDIDPNQRIRLKKIIQNRQGGEKNLLSLTDIELDVALRLVTEVGGEYVPTVAGMLLMGKEGRIAELIPAAKSTFQVLEGTSIRLNEDGTKPLLETLENYEMYLKAWNPEEEMEYGLIRMPIPEFDWAAFREGIVNAFCHRDYTVLGSVRVLIDDEGLSISNPGGFIDGVNLKNLLTVEPHGRNPALADAMKRIGLAEKTGRGIDRIFEGSIMYGRPWPDYSESTSTTVKLFIQRSKADYSFVKFISDEQAKRGKPLSISSLMILSTIKDERRAGVERIAEVTNIDVNKIRAAMENMLEQGLIEASGKGNHRTFILSKRLYKQNRETIKYVRQTDIDAVRYPELILKLAKTQDGIITKKDVAELLKISDTQAYVLIKSLRKEGKLELLNSGKYTKYKVK